MKNVMLIFFLTFLAGCEAEKSNVKTPTDSRSTQNADTFPACVKNKIEEIKKENVRNPPGAVYRYTYNNQNVYFIPSYCCDFFSYLLDENCNVICSPDGGIVGKGDGKCKEFFNVRTNEELIWQDERTQP